MDSQASSSEQHSLSISFLNNNIQLFDLITKQFQDVDINVYGTFDEPLFDAKQIGDLLDIKDVITSMTNLDDSEKRQYTMLDGKKKQMLTEDGICEIILLSVKPNAKEFRKWVKGTIREIRKSGENKQKQQYEQRELLYQQREEQHQQEKKQLIEQNNRYKKEREDYTNTFEKQSCNKHLYIFRQGNDERNVHYIGQSKGVQARLSSHKNSNCYGLEDVHKIPCINDKLCENIIHTILQKQGYHHKNDPLSSGSFYTCTLRYKLLLSKYVCNTINLLYQCRQYIQEPELIQKLQEEFEQTHILVQDDIIELRQELVIQQSQAQSLNDENKITTVSNKDQNDSISVDSIQKSQQDPIASWIKQNLKYNEGKYVMADDIWSKYSDDTDNNIGKYLFNRQVNEYFIQNPEDYSGIVYDLIDINRKDNKVKGKGFKNCSFKE